MKGENDVKKSSSPYRKQQKQEEGDGKRGKEQKDYPHSPSFSSFPSFPSSPSSSSHVDGERLGHTVDDRQQLGLMVSDILMAGRRGLGRGFTATTTGSSSATTYGNAVMGFGGAGGGGGITSSFGLTRNQNSSGDGGTNPVSTSSSPPTSSVAVVTTTSSSSPSAVHWRHRQLPPPLLSELAPGPTSIWQRVVTSAIESARGADAQGRYMNVVSRKFKKELKHYHEEAKHRVEREGRQQRESRARLGYKLHQLSERYWKRRGELFQQAMRTEFQTIRQHYDRQKQEDMLAETEELTKKLVESMVTNRKVLFPSCSSSESAEGKEKEEERRAPVVGKPIDRLGGDDGKNEEEEKRTNEASSSSADERPPLALLDTLNGTRPLRSYQCSALQWMIHLFENRLNGILADEMGLGKTVQTIALLCYYAQYHNDWGPHLIVVPTTVMLNWRDELQRWAPGLKIMVYMGSRRERQWGRKGWLAEDAFHVCITSYTLVVHDQAVFRRRPWGFLVLDEAHQIKNFLSRKWQSLFDLNVEYRLLLTGTPLQNSMMELWSLFHFLLPSASAFRSNEEFKEWFSNPLEDMVSGRSALNESIIRRLQGLLRPFILRRLKVDVESQLPAKVEHIVRCRLSRRQRALYDEHLQRRETKQRLEKGGVFSVLLALRKVCNHPDLFAERPTVSPFVLDRGKAVVVKVPRLVLLQEQTFAYHFPGTGATRWDLEVWDMNEDVRKAKKRREVEQKPMATKRMRREEKRTKWEEGKSVEEEEGEDEEEEKGERVADSDEEDKHQPTRRPNHYNEEEELKRKGRKRRGEVPRANSPRTSSQHRHRQHHRRRPLPACLVAYVERQKRLDGYSSPFDWLPCSWMKLNVLIGVPPPIYEDCDRHPHPHHRSEEKKCATFSSSPSRSSLSFSSSIFHYPDTSPFLIQRYSPTHLPASFLPNSIQVKEEHEEEEEKKPKEEALLPGRLALSGGLLQMLTSSCTNIVDYTIQNRRRCTYHCQSLRQKEVATRTIYLYYPRCVSSLLANGVDGESSYSASTTSTSTTAAAFSWRGGRWEREGRGSWTQFSTSAFFSSFCSSFPELFSSSYRLHHELLPLVRHIAVVVPKAITRCPPTLVCALPLRRPQCFQWTSAMCAPLIAWTTREAEQRRRQGLQGQWKALVGKGESYGGGVTAGHGWGEGELAPRVNVYDGSRFLAEWWPLQVRRCFSFPDRYLIIHDSGKLQYLKEKLVLLRSEGHRALIFTQFVKMLDVLESFLALIGVAYLRLDGATPVEQRQLFVNRFNSDDRITLMILSTRSGGIGLNLTGADTVIFYDSDWNPTMDLQAQDRCHRIGQTRPVTVYRLVSSHTVEESILKKAKERKKLNNVVIRGGRFHAIATIASSSGRGVGRGCGGEKEGQVDLAYGGGGAGVGFSASNRDAQEEGTRGGGGRGGGEEEEEELTDEATAAAWAMLSIKTDLRSFFHDMDEDVEIVPPAGEVGSTATPGGDEEEEEEGEHEVHQLRHKGSSRGVEKSSPITTSFPHQGTEDGLGSWGGGSAALSPPSLQHIRNTNAPALGLSDLLEEMRCAEDEEDRMALEQAEAEIRKRKKDDEVTSEDDEDNENEEEENKSHYRKQNKGDQDEDDGEEEEEEGKKCLVEQEKEKKVYFEDDKRGGGSSHSQCSYTQGHASRAELEKEARRGMAPGEHPTAASTFIHNNSNNYTPEEVKQGNCRRAASGGIEKEEAKLVEEEEEGREGGERKTCKLGEVQKMLSAFSQTWEDAWGETKSPSKGFSTSFSLGRRTNKDSHGNKQEAGGEGKPKEEDGKGDWKRSGVSSLDGFSSLLSSSLYAKEPALRRTAIRRQRTFMDQRTRSAVDRQLSRHYAIYRPDNALDLYRQLREEYEEKIHIPDAELPPFRDRLA